MHIYINAHTECGCLVIHICECEGACMYACMYVHVYTHGANSLRKSFKQNNSPNLNNWPSDRTPRIEPCEARLEVQRIKSPWPSWPQSNPRAQLAGQRWQASRLLWHAVGCCPEPLVMSWHCSCSLPWTGWRSCGSNGSSTSSSSSSSSSRRRSSRRHSAVVVVVVCRRRYCCGCWLLLWLLELVQKPGNGSKRLTLNPKPLHPKPQNPQP